MNDKIPASIIQALLGAQQNVNPQTSGSWQQGGNVANIPGQGQNPKQRYMSSGNPAQQYQNPNTMQGSYSAGPTNRPYKTQPVPQPQQPNNGQSGGWWNRPGVGRPQHQQQPKIPRPNQNGQGWQQFRGQNGGNQQQMFANLLRALGLNLPGGPDQNGQG